MVVVKEGMLAFVDMPGDVVISLVAWLFHVHLERSMRARERARPAGVLIA